MTAIVYDGADARRWTTSGLAADMVLALSPAAEAALAGSGAAVVPLAARMGERGHRRVASRARANDRRLAAALAADPAVGPLAAASLRHDSHYLGAFAGALLHALGPVGPWLVPTTDGFRAFDRRDRAAAALAAHILAKPGAFRTGAMAAVPGVNALNRLVARLLPDRFRLAVTAHGYGFDHLSHLAGRRVPSLGLVEVRGASGRWTDLALPLRSLWRAVRGAGLVSLAVSGRCRPAQVRACRAALGDGQEPVIAAALSPVLDRLAVQAARVEAMVAPMRRLLGVLRPKAVLAHALRWESERAAAAAARLADIPVVLVSHGSHSDPARMSAAAAYSHKVNAEDLLVSDAADFDVAQSPHAEAAVAAMAPAARVLRTRPIQWAYKPVPPARLEGGVRRILHAGTFKPLPGLRPAIYETASEFVAGLAPLVEAVATIPDAELVVRLRAHTECGLDDLLALLPKAPNLRVKSHRDGSFLEDLATARVLVSFSSTTIEEALHARRPVVLWGGLGGYHHLPARSLPPSAGDRAAVYAPKGQADLRSLLCAVLDAHATPLTDAELAGQVWGEDVPGAADFLTVLDEGLTGGGGSCTRGGVLSGV